MTNEEFATGVRCFKFLYFEFTIWELSVDVDWMQAADGARQAICVDGRATGGAHAVIESVAQAGTAVPTHRHHNEAEHFLVLPVITL